MKKIFLFTIFLIAIFLRLFQISKNPPSLYWEEVALGYDAYSLLKTGQDHRGNPWPVVYISSYMDYKPPFYVYATIPSVAIFGLNEFGVRFPSALFGTLTVLVIYFLTKELFRVYLKSSILNLTSLMASFLLAISPWHLQFSRAAFEANLALFLITLGCWLFLLAFRKKYYLFLAVIPFGLSFYAYHAARVFTPLLLFGLLIFFFKRLWRIKWVSLTALLLGLMFVLPLLCSLSDKEIGQRFQETSAFTDLEPIIKSNLEIQKDGNTRLAKIIHHRFLEYGKIFLTNYFSHFNGNYLFLSGDSNPRHSTQEFGILYHFEIFTLILGIILVLKLRDRRLYFLLSWLVISLVPGAITKATPHALRTIFALPPFIIISSIGLVQLLKLFSRRKFLLLTFYFLLFTDFLLYLHFYYSHYPKIYSSYWQYGYKQAINFLKSNEDKYEAIYLTNNYGRAYMYYLFYSQLNPKITQELIISEGQEKMSDIKQLGKIFIGQVPTYGHKILWIASPGEKQNGKLLTTIDDLNNNRVFEIWETY